MIDDLIKELHEKGEFAKELHRIITLAYYRGREDYRTELIDIQKAMKEKDKLEGVNNGQDK